MRVTEKNLEHTKEVLNHIYYILNRFYMNSGSSDVVSQIRTAQEAVNGLESNYIELESDLNGLNDYINEQEYLMEKDTVIVQTENFL